MSTITVRPYQGTDEAALLALWNTALPYDRIAPNVLRTKVLLDPNFTPAGLLLAEEEGQVVGFVLALTRQTPLFLQGLEPERAWITAFGVHPAHRRRGVGRALFSAILDRLAAEGRATALISPYTPNYFTPGVDQDAYPEAMAFLLAQGWRVISTPISMHVELTSFSVPAALAAHQERLHAETGIAVHPVQPADLPALMPFIATHFGWDWHRHATEYLSALFGPGADDICFLVAERQGEIVGYCQQRRERFGPFGVMPSLRSQGIGRVLLFRCLEEMTARGFHAAWFLWTGADAARLYSTAGFRQARRFAVLAYDLQPTQQAI